MGQKTTQSTIWSDLSLLIVAVIWGSGFMAVQMAIDAKFSPTLILVMRFVVATILLYAVFFRKLRKFTRDELKCGIIAGVLLFLSFYSQTVGLVYTTPSNNAFITATNVVMVPFISWFLMKKRPKPRVFIAAFIGFIGIAVLTFSFAKGLVLNLGDLLSLLCAFLFACHLSYVGYSAKKVETTRLTFLQMAVAAVLAVVTLVAFDLQSIPAADFDAGLLPVIYLGIFCTCVAFFIQIRAQKRTSSTKAAVFLSMEAVFGSLFSVLLGYEGLTANLIIGGVVVIGSILLLEIKSPTTN